MSLTVENSRLTQFPAYVRIPYFPLSFPITVERGGGEWYDGKRFPLFAHAIIKEMYLQLKTALPHTGNLDIPVDRSTSNKTHVTWREEKKKEKKPAMCGGGTVIVTYNITSSSSRRFVDSTRSLVKLGRYQ